MPIDSKQVVKNLRKIARALEGAVDRGLAAAANELTVQARAGTKGKLAENINPTRIGPYHHRVIANTFYASWVEFGNGPAGSRIYPKKAKALHFFINGEEIFAKSVKTSTPRYYMTSAFGWAKQEVPNIVGRYVEAAIKRVIK